MEKIRGIIEKIFLQKVSLAAYLSVFLGVIAIRVFVEQFLARAAEISIYEIFIEYIHNLFFFGISFVLIWLLLSLVLKSNPKKFTGIFSWASLLIILPPILDMAKTRGEVFWSFYVLGGPRELARNLVTFFGDLPSGIVYFGTRIVFAAAILLIFIFIYARTKELVKAFWGALGTYLILFIMGCFPSIFFMFLGVPFLDLKIADVKPFRVAQFFGSPQKIWGIEPFGIKYAFAYKLDIIYFLMLVFFLAVMLFFVSRTKFMAVAKNFRLPQLVYHSGLFFIGMGLGLLQFRENFSLNIFSLAAVATLLLSVWLAWKASVVVNDIYDLEIDRISNAERPLPSGAFGLSGYIQFGFLCFLLSLLGGLTIGFKFFVLLLVYQIIAWFYSAEPLRLKKFPGVATFVSSLASLMVLFLGYILVADGQTVGTLSWRIILLLILGYTLSIPIKDFKDVEGDGKYHIWTVPVLFGEKKGRLIVGTGIFISYIASVFFLNELKLFFWALLGGSITFLAVTSKKTKPTEMFWWVLGVAFLYGLILVKTVFL
jgi:4-hydroxybenzoate polyprenyltransferase